MLPPGCLEHDLRRPAEGVNTLRRSGRIGAQGSGGEGGADNADPDPGGDEEEGDLGEEAPAERELGEIWRTSTDPGSEGEEGDEEGGHCRSTRPDDPPLDQEGESDVPI